ncbi:MAG: hypothetical protein LBB40_02775 [Holophagales bacterium]|jgi:Ser-tRNA(Ala) deacylase AlaX|nr:hypothetical protein [Holophagales bacterium]
MRERKTFETDAYARELKTNILKVFENKGYYCVVLEDSILFPEGGGQPGDRGRIGSANVLDVIHGHSGDTREDIHIVDSLLEPGPTEVHLDWKRRFDHMQQHTGQHLLTAVARGRFGWATTAFHLGPDLCDIELDAPQITRGQRHELEEAVIGEIIAARSVSAFWVTQEEYKTRDVRSRGLPDGHQGDVRLVEIQGLDINTCGGTHMSSTSELECLKLLSAEPIRGGTRLFFIFGKRLRDRMEAHEQRGHQLRTILGRPDDALAAAIEQRIAHEKELERSLRHTEDELADLYAKFMAAEPGTLLVRHFENKDAGFLQKIVRLLLELDNNRAIFVTAEKDGNAFFSLAAGSACEADIPKLGREAAAVLNGKGGGSGRQFQGKFGDLSKLREAAAILRAGVK